jgi:hypothetical protein
MANLSPIGQFITNPTNLIIGSVRLQRNYLWDVLLPDIGVKMAGLGGLLIGQLVQSVQFGDYSIDNPTTMRMGAFQASFAGLLTVDKLNMTFLKTMPDGVSAYFNAWKNLIVDKQGLFHPKNDYQRTIFVRFIDSTGIAFGQYKFIGCFPTLFPKYTDLNYESNTVTKIQVAFTVDKIEYQWF